MNATELLPQIKIASPCRARWEDMAGDERSRFCAQCQKHVYNFSTMTPDAIAELVKVKEGRLCARFYRRADATMLTVDCPVSAARSARRIKTLLVAGVAFCCMAFTALSWKRASMGDVRTGPKGAFARRCEEAVVRAQVWLGLRREPCLQVMGRICVPSSPVVPNPGSPASQAPAPPSSRQPLK